MFFLFRKMLLCSMDENGQQVINRINMTRKCVKHCAPHKKPLSRCFDFIKSCRG